MSHICRSLVKLGANVNRDLLKQVVNFLATKRGGSIVTAVQDFYGTKSQVDFGLRTPNFERGIGIIFKQDGTVEFVCDAYRFESEVEALKQDILQTYTAEAVAAALNILGYKVQTQEVNKQPIISGVKED